MTFLEPEDQTPSVLKLGRSGLRIGGVHLGETSDFVYFETEGRWRPVKVSNVSIVLPQADGRPGIVAYIREGKRFVPNRGDPGVPADVPETITGILVP